MPRLDMTVSRKGKPYPLASSSSKVNWMLALIEFRCWWNASTWSFLGTNGCRQHNKTTIWKDLALTITKERLHLDQNLAERTTMSVTNVMKLLDFVLTNNYFKHDGHHYKTDFWVCNVFTNQSCVCRPRNGSNRRDSPHHSSSSS